MSLFANPSYTSPGGQLWARKTAGGTVEEPAFTATGIGQPGGDGRFVARGDAAAGSPALAFQMRTSGVSALQQWNIGMTDAPAGANSGNNFAIFAYDDASNLLSVPLSINRASGAVSANNGMTVNGDLVVSQDISGATVHSGGQPVLIQQLDFTVNLNNTLVILPATPAAGQTITPLGPTFTPERTGIYLLSAILSYNGSGGTTFVAAPQDYFSVIMTPTPPSPGASVGGVTVPLTVNGENDRSWEGMATIKLTGGVPYQANFYMENISGTVAATGGAAIAGSYDIVALC